MINNDTRKEQIVLNSTKPHEMAEFKRGSKLSNLEVNQREVPLRSTRPLSYTPSSQNEPLYNCNNTVLLNNLDTLRSYGSAGKTDICVHNCKLQLHNMCLGDELENVPPDYVRNLNLNTQQVGIGNHCDSEKTTWAEQMQLACTYDKPRIKNGKLRVESS